MVLVLVLVLRLLARLLLLQTELGHRATVGRKH